jgi:hypothetical protein
MLVINPTSPTKTSMEFQSNYHNTQGFPKQQSNRVGKFPWHLIEPIELQEEEKEGVFRSYS